MLLHKQKLESYGHEFLNYRDWVIVESPHYIFHFTPDSDASHDIEHIEDVQEAAFEKIIKTLGLPLPRKKISYYFYPDLEFKKTLMGDDGYAQAVYEEFCIHVLYDRSHKLIGPHEDTHLLSLPWGLSWNFLQEGLAEWMVGSAWDGNSHQHHVRKGLRIGLPLKPSQQLGSEDWYKTPDAECMYYYALAGLWTTFLINNFGLETYKKLYMGTDRSMPPEIIKKKYRECYGRSVEDLEATFLKGLK
jgi:hypothetical protein